jgi:hypothetical protein
MRSARATSRARCRARRSRCSTADAEGRLVLADANEYIAQTYKPRAIVNIATLTGAIVGALDDQYAGLFARDEKLAAALLAAGAASGEEVWRMPLHKNYAEKLKSDIADIRNIAPEPGTGRQPRRACDRLFSSTKRRRGRISTSPGSIRPTRQHRSCPRG